MVIYPNSKAAETTPTPTPKQSLNSSVGVDRELLLSISQDLTNHAQSLAASIEARLETPMAETSAESQENTQQLLDWVADLYAIGADIQAYLNPEVGDNT